GEFFRDVDVLIIECSLPDELAMDAHLTPGRVARIAADAAPRHLVLTHVSPQLEVREVPARLAAAGRWGGAVGAADGTRLVIRGRDGDVPVDRAPAAPAPLDAPQSARQNTAS